MRRHVRALVLLPGLLLLFGCAAAANGAGSPSVRASSPPAASAPASAPAPATSQGPESPAAGFEHPGVDTPLQFAGQDLQRSATLTVTRPPAPRNGVG